METLEDLRKRYDSGVQTMLSFVRRTTPDVDHRRIQSFSVTPQHDGSQHVEIRDDRYFCIGTERGSVTSFRSTSDHDELLYWLLNSAASGLASGWELRHRKENEDFRRQYFAKTIELLTLLSPKWGERKRIELERVLESHPFRDGA